MTLHVVTRENPSEADRKAVLRPLRAYNTARAGDPRIRPVALLLADEAGNHVGGLWGECAYDWLFVELLAVPEEYWGKNYGKTLMERAKEIARANDCVGIWLNTSEFQARGFYEKLGFEVFGTLDNYPVGQKTFFLRKRLPTAPGGVR